MGCLLIGVAALLSLAMPAAIARSSLIGAYVLIALLTIVACAVVRWRQRSRREPGGRSVPTATVRIGIIAVVYAALVTGVHFVG